jgi:hypothetical protein
MTTCSLTTYTGNFMRFSATVPSDPVNKQYVFISEQNQFPVETHTTPSAILPENLDK